MSLEEGQQSKTDFAARFPAKDVISHDIAVCLTMYLTLQELQQGGVDVAIGNLIFCIP